MHGPLRAKSTVVRGLRCFGEHASERVVGRWGRGFGSRPRRHYGAASVGLVTLCRELVNAALFRFLAR